MNRIAFALPLLLTFAACVDAEDDLATDTQALQPCPKLWGCGENSPVMGPWEFHELDTAGATNLEGVRLLGLVQGNTMYQVHVTGARLWAEDSVGNTLTGTQLTNAYLAVWANDGLWKIFIKKVSPVATSFTTFWVGPATPIETYELTYNHSSGDPRPLCNAPPERVSGEGNQRMWVRPLEAIIYTGDRYNSTDKTVTAASYTAAGTWFNIGCAGSALAKLVLTRHATVGSNHIYQSTRAQRQAMLKMYVSDVCGTGTAFTVKGTPLHWENTLGWSALDGTEWAHESMWNQGGALCLDTHRLGSTYDAEIHQECASVGHSLPACAGLSFLPGSYYLSSAVPFAVP
jgi:hypothetical protein